MIKENIPLPCAETLEVEYVQGGRIYRYKDFVWDTRGTHRVVLVAAILEEDKRRYKEKYLNIKQPEGILNENSKTAQDVLKEGKV